MTHWSWLDRILAGRDHRGMSAPHATALRRARRVLVVGALLVSVSFEARAPSPAMSVDEQAVCAPMEPIAVDTHHAGQVSIQAGPPVPLKPADWQKRPPCNWDEAREVELFGACYVRVADTKPPCPPRLFSQPGRCYVAVARAPRPSNTVDGK